MRGVNLLDSLKDKPKKMTKSSKIILKSKDTRLGGRNRNGGGETKLKNSKGRYS